MTSPELARKNGHDSSCDGYCCMETGIKDCFGVAARVGDQIAFSQGNAGAKAWEHAVIIKVTSKTVTFRARAGWNGRDWQDLDSTELRRGDGCFVIDVSKREVS